MWDLMDELNERGVTIILTTHYFEEAERMCRNIAIINEGVIITNAPKYQLLDQADNKVFTLYLTNPLNRSLQLANVDIKQLEPQVLELSMQSDKTALGTIFSQLETQGITVKKMSSKDSMLEQVFMKLVDKNSVEKMTDGADQQ